MVKYIRTNLRAKAPVYLLQQLVVVKHRIRHRTATPIRFPSWGQERMSPQYYTLFAPWHVEKYVEYICILFITNA